MDEASNDRAVFFSMPVLQVLASVAGIVSGFFL
jgi:hypothetical protein